jgi:hypothetical protein
VNGIGARFGGVVFSQVVSALLIGDSLRLVVLLRVQALKSSQPIE